MPSSLLSVLLNVREAVFWPDFLALTTARADVVRILVCLVHQLVEHLTMLARTHDSHKLSPHNSSLFKTGILAYNI
ncbi:MAG TPA: hypothetical protein VFX17_00085 [Patescibacteria group bacterium]|nr:hypothetical protein [Patescibacteria group bacterium]